MMKRYTNPRLLGRKMEGCWMFLRKNPVQIYGCLRAYLLVNWLCDWWRDNADTVPLLDVATTRRLFWRARSSSLLLQRRSLQRCCRWTRATRSCRKPRQRLAISVINWRSTVASLGNKSVPKKPENYSKWQNKLIFYTAASMSLVSNHISCFRVLFDKIASIYFIWKIYLYLSIGNGQPREPALCLLYRHTVVPYCELRSRWCSG